MQFKGSTSAVCIRALLFGSRTEWRQDRTTADALLRSQGLTRSRPGCSKEARALALDESRLWEDSIERLRENTILSGRNEEMRRGWARPVGGHGAHCVEDLRGKVATRSDRDTRKVSEKANMKILAPDLAIFNQGLRAPPQWDGNIEAGGLGLGSERYLPAWNAKKLNFSSISKKRIL